jgi:hypothetical protein
MMSNLWNLQPSFKCFNEIVWFSYRWLRTVRQGIGCARRRILRCIFSNPTWCSSFMKHHRVSTARPDAHVAANVKSAECFFRSTSNVEHHKTTENKDKQHKRQAKRQKLFNQASKLSVWFSYRWLRTPAYRMRTPAYAARCIFSNLTWHYVNKCSLARARWRARWHDSPDLKLRECVGSVMLLHTFDC